MENQQQNESTENTKTNNKHLNMANRFHDFSHSIPEKLNTHNGNGYFTNHTCQATQTGGHAHNTSPYRMKNTSNEQQGFYHRGSPRSNSSLDITFPHKYYNHALHSSNIITYHLETIATTLGMSSSLLYEVY